MSGAPPTPAPQALDPRAVALWRVQALIGFFTFLLPLSLLTAALAFVTLGRGLPLAVVLIALALAASLLLVVQTVLWPPLAWERYRYALREHELWIGRGVIFKQQTLIPRDRIQFVDTRQGPIEQVFGLSRLLVYTASGLAADGGIPGLARPVAEALRDELARRGGEDGL